MYSGHAKEQITKKTGESDRDQRSHHQHEQQEPPNSVCLKICGRNKKMLFNSYAFILFFLPVVAILFFVFARYVSARVAAAWLAAASIIFYGYWSPRYVVLLLGSIVVNYIFSIALQRTVAAGWARVTLALAIAANLAILGYFKYFNFFLDSLSHFGVELGNVSRIILPIGISFFTFTQIAYLVDTCQRKVREFRFIPYLLFITYFPHLIAGPILHHAEMMPQFAKKETYRFDLHNLSMGLAIFAAGLFKKVVLADGIQPFVAPVFDVGSSVSLSALEAWGGALAYTMQLYFDFSGYSDMAVGLSKMFNVDLPLNFNSPYKALNIVEFWRRWHMTLSRFLRDYLYIPLGGNRLGGGRRYFNLASTMILGGLWHGAAWTFVIWGALHGVFLVINHSWQGLRKKVFRDTGSGSQLGQVLGWAITFIAVVYAWVFFRASSFDVAWSLTAAMSGLNGWLPSGEARLWENEGQMRSALDGLSTNHFAGTRQVLWVVSLAGIAWFLPNTQELGASLSRWLAVSPARLISRSGLLLGIVFTMIILLVLINGGRGNSTFIYFNF